MITKVFRRKKSPWKVFAVRSSRPESLISGSGKLEVPKIMFGPASEREVRAGPVCVPFLQLYLLSLLRHSR
jgi:hypothetical protein